MTRKIARYRACRTPNDNGAPERHPASRPVARICKHDFDLLVVVVIIVGEAAFRHFLAGHHRSQFL